MTSIEAEGWVERSARSLAARVAAVLREALAVAQVLLEEGWNRLRATSPAWFAYLFAGWLALATLIAVAGLVLFVAVVLF